jgi:peptide methionine sulfoxide reductase MsrA
MTHRLEASGEYDEPIVTEILPADTFFKAEVRRKGRREGGRARHGHI